MHSVFALMRASFLSATSYRLATVLSFAGLIVSIVPLYLVADALQPVVAGSISGEGGGYFGFLVVGLAATYLMMAAVSALPGAIAGGLGSGTFEARLVTKTSLPVLLVGMAAYPLAQAVLRAILLVALAMFGGVRIHWASVPYVAVIALLLVVAYASFGLVAAALVLVFRTSGPLISAVVAGSSLLGGVYYSAAVIPSWLQDLSALVPLTYALRAARMLMLGGAEVPEVVNDLSALTLMASLGITLSALAFAAALRYARRAGTLSQY